MIVDLPSTTTVGVSKKLVRAARQDTGAMALGRVLTLLIVVDEHDAEEAIEAANDASRQHPCRIIAVVIGNKRGSRGSTRRSGSAATPARSEVVVLRLYGALTDHGRSVVIPLLLPDSPVVAWWPTDAPAHVAQRPDRLDGPAADHRRRRVQAARGPRSSRAPRPTPAATPTSPGRGSRCGGGCSPPPSTSRPSSRSSRRPSPAAPTPRPTDLLAAWLALTPAVPGAPRPRPAPAPAWSACGWSAAAAPSTWSARDGSIATPQPARPAGPPDLPGPPGDGRVPRRRAAPPRPRRDLRGDASAAGWRKVGTKSVRPPARRSARARRRRSRRPSAPPAGSPGAASKASSAEMVQAPAPTPTADTAVVKKAAARKLAKTKATGTTAKAKAAAKRAPKARQGHDAPPRVVVVHPDKQAVADARRRPARRRRCSTPRPRAARRTCR